MKEIIIFDNHKIPRKLRGKTLYCYELDKFPYYATDTGKAKSHKMAIGTKETAGIKTTIRPNGFECKKLDAETIWLRPLSYSLKTLKQSRVPNS